MNDPQPQPLAPFGPEYPKIQTVFKRDMEDGGVIIPDTFTTEEFEYLADSQWTWTEKVDGTNVRLHFNGENITAGGRTDSAQTPGHLIYALAKYNSPEKWRKVFDPDEREINALGSLDVTLYGEGYGPKIQNGGRYRSDVSFILFDVRVGRWWLKREDVVDVAAKLGMDVVPVVATCTLSEAISLVKHGARQTSADQEPLYSRVSTVDDFTMEGLVGTPSVPLFDRRGSRIIAKLKVKDFEDLAKRNARRGTIDTRGGGVATYE